MIAKDSMILPVQPGCVAWYKATPNEKYQCPFCHFWFGSDHVVRRGDEPMLVLVLGPATEGRWRCPACTIEGEGNLEDYYAIELITHGGLREIAQAPKEWLMPATSEDLPSSRAGHLSYVASLLSGDYDDDDE